MAKLDLDPESSPYIDMQLGYTPKKRTGRNVMAFIDNGASHTLVIGAHLDHLGYGEDENSRHTGEPTIHNGADDNASGTAAVLELARKLSYESKTTNPGKKQLPVHPAIKNNNYLLLHFSGEELGLYGSKYFVENPSVDLGKINGMINLDMVGRLNDSNVLTVGGLGSSPAWSKHLPDGKAAGFIIRIDSTGTGPSDHTSFYRKDIPVLFFFTGLHADYHKPEDDADKINYAGETRIIDYIMNLITGIGNEGRLAFTKTKERSIGGGRFKVSVGIMPDYTFTGSGVRADGIINGRPAQKAGMQAGDIIIRLGEFEVTNIDTYMQALNKFEVGQSTQLVIKRGNDTKNLQVTF